MRRLAIVFALLAGACGKDGCFYAATDAAHIEACGRTCGEAGVLVVDPSRGMCVCQPRRAP